MGLGAHKSVGVEVHVGAVMDEAVEEKEAPFAACFVNSKSWKLSAQDGCP